MSETALPAGIEALARGPIDGEAIARLRAHYIAGGPITSAEADQLFVLQRLVADRATPEFEAFLREALATYLAADFNPFVKAFR